MKSLISMLVITIFRRGLSIWPVAYKVELHDEATFLISLGLDDDAEMIQPEELASHNFREAVDAELVPLHSLTADSYTKEDKIPEAELSFYDIQRTLFYEDNNDQTDKVLYGVFKRQAQESNLTSFLLNTTDDTVVIANTSDIDKEYAYDYELFKAEYYEDIEEDKKDGNILNSTEHGPESVKDAMKTIATLEPKDCMKEAFIEWGFIAIKCLFKDLQNANTTEEYDKIKWRAVTIFSFWTIVYAVIASTLWCCYGWCCCCCQCKACYPDVVLREAKEYMVNNPPGVMVLEDGTTKEYTPSVFERDSYLQLQHSIHGF